MNKKLQRLIAAHNAAIDSLSLEQSAAIDRLIVATLIAAFEELREGNMLGPFVRNGCGQVALFTVLENEAATGLHHKSRIFESEALDA